MAIIERRGGDSYLASLSDLMIGLLFIFIIILMSFALSYKATQESSEVERGKLVAENQALTDSDHLRSEILNEVQDSLRRRGVKVQVDLTHGVLRLPESLLFDEGSAEFRPGGEDAVAKLGDVLAAVLPCYAADSIARLKCRPGQKGRIESIFVEGHTDNTPISNGDFHDNWDLSVARAKNTYSRLLQDDKSDADRSRSATSLEALRNGSRQFLFSMSAYGDKRPVSSNMSSGGRAQNRRIDLRFIMAPPLLQDTGPTPSSAGLTKVMENVAPSQRAVQR
jgi:chemotaxis protein MotB